MTDNPNLNGQDPQEKQEAKKEEGGVQPPVSEQPAEQPAEGGELPQQKQEEYPSILSKPAQREQKKPSKRKLSKTARNIIITAVLCVALVGSIFAIYQFLPEPEGGDSSAVSSEEEQYLFDYSKYISYNEETETKGVKTVEVKNDVAEFQIGYTIAQEETTDVNTGTTSVQSVIKWNIPAVKGVDFDSTSIGFLINDLLKPAYTGVYAEDGSAKKDDSQTYYQECGFETPKSVLKITFNDGNVVTLTVGGQTPTKAGYYVMVSGDPKIYHASNEDVAYFLKPLLTFVNKEIVTAMQPEAEEDPYFYNNDLIRFDSIVISGKSVPKTMTFEYREKDSIGSTSVYRLLTPQPHYVSNDSIDKLLKPVNNGLSASECLVMLATASDYKNYGLDAPAYQAVYKVRSTTVTLKVGKQVEDGYYAVCVNGKNTIYKVDAANLPFVGVEPKDFYESALYQTDITMVSAITARFKNSSGQMQTVKFSLNHGVETDSSGNSEPTLTVVTDTGVTCNVDDFREYYRSIISLTASQFVEDGKEAAQPDLTLTFQYVNNSKSDVIKFSSYSARRYFYTLNGQGDALVVANDVNSIISQMESLIKGQ